MRKNDKYVVVTEREFKSAKRESRNLFVIIIILFVMLIMERNDYRELQRLLDASVNLNVYLLEHKGIVVDIFPEELYSS